ncbi:Hypothetical protein SRAE_1000296600 [Strongyloides ratti]|uniref:Uncharacterized protein n=1 Tax=Strongyloides ratti TaxID=34506 RepID=A0A090L9D2_STRRB|nr:Hypothetical protein SRAE_1000296600 [Strongyloides ratti]CEF64713.1 Hypothetical protein SRAE_1000296600 [Strongyloides ratti]
MHFIKYLSLLVLLAIQVASQDYESRELGLIRERYGDGVFGQKNRYKRKSLMKEFSAKVKDIEGKVKDKIHELGQKANATLQTVKKKFKS